MYKYAQICLYIYMYEQRFRFLGKVLSLWGLAQAFQNPLIKEYTLNYSRVPNMI